MYHCEIWADAGRCFRNLSDIHAKYWEPYYYVTNILICCGRCIAVKFGQMLIHSVQVPIHASEILSDIHAMHQKFVGHPCYLLGTILLYYRYINLLQPIYSCEILADADPFCAGADPCIRNLLDIHAMYWEPYYYITDILICCSQCIA